VGVHVHGEPVYLTYLHSILIFILLRNRETLLEQRGLERTKLASTEASRNAFFDRENVFSRYVNVSGFVRQYWPKRIVPRITSVMVQPQIGLTGEAPIQTPVDLIADEFGLEGLAWIGDGTASTLPAQTAQYGIRGGNTSPGAPTDLGPPDGVQGPSVGPQPNGQTASATEDDGLVGTEGNLAEATVEGIVPQHLLEDEDNGD
jgi:hypothetical protein